jgi:hypothetical protein
MRRWLAVGCFLALAASARDTPHLRKKTCSFGKHKLYGKVQVVTAFPDLKVQTVDAFPDLRVEKVDAFADACGKWQFVDAFPDFTVQLVDAFPDVKIEYVDAFPGVD